MEELLKDGDFGKLENCYDDHCLDRRMEGLKAIHLFPGAEKNSKDDVVVVYEILKNDDIALRRIGTHNKVYDRNYKKYWKSEYKRSRRT